MKTSVRFLSLLLAVLMLAGAALTASADNIGKANSEALQLLVDLGIIGGYEDGSLKPDKLVERDEMAKIIFVLYTTFSDAGEGTVSFKDVAADNWAAGYISWCSARGIVGGYGDGNFGPDDNVTYDQALKMVCGALGYKDWDPTFWPIDVRTKALRDLDLGENLEGVNGSDKVTRAQVAQIVYNALFEDMNETKQDEIIIEGTSLISSTPMTLAEDVWSFGTYTTYIYDTQDAYLNSALASEDNDVRVPGIGEFTLEELGLEEYENKLTDLLFSKIKIFYDKKSAPDASDITAEDIYAVSITETVERNLAATYDEEDNELLLNGNYLAEGAYELSSTDSNGHFTRSLYVDEFADDSDPVASLEAITSANVEFAAYNLDDDDEYEYVVKFISNPIEIKSVTDKRVSYSLLGSASIVSVPVEKVVTNSVLAEDDVAVAEFVYDKLIVKEVVAPVVAKATRFNEKVLTLEGAGQVKINEKVFSAIPVYEVTNSVMTLNEKGETTAYEYYIYDGRVFYGDVVADESDFKFAMLSYINIPDDAVFNPETMQFEKSYTALITVDGVDMTVNINPVENTIDTLNMIDNYTEIIENYGKAFTNGKDEDEDGKEDVVEDGKYVLNRKQLVTYTVDEDGYYTFKTTNASNDKYTVITNAATIEYNSKLGLYTIKAADGTVISSAAVLEDDSVLYYTYKEAETGEHVYIDSYSAKTLPRRFASANIIGDVYLTVNEDEPDFDVVKVAVIDDDSIVKTGETTADFRKDSRLLYYCYTTSNEALAEDGISKYYTYYMKGLYNGTNSGKVINEEKTVAEGATKARSGYIYAWDDANDKYVQISKSTMDELGVECIGTYTLDYVVNGCIVTKDGKFAEGGKIEPDTCIWAFNRAASTYITLTVDGLAETLRIAKEIAETESEETGNDVQANVKVMVGTHIDENGDEVISTIIVDYYRYNSYGQPLKPNDAANTIFTSFNN